MTIDRPGAAIPATHGLVSASLVGWHGSAKGMSTQNDDPGAEAEVCHSRSKRARTGLAVIVGDEELAFAKLVERHKQRNVGLDAASGTGSGTGKRSESEAIALDGVGADMLGGSAEGRDCSRGGCSHVPSSPNPIEAEAAREATIVHVAEGEGPISPCVSQVIWASAARLRHLVHGCCGREAVSSRVGQPGGREGLGARNLSAIENPGCQGELRVSIVPAGFKSHFIFGYAIFTFVTAFPFSLELLLVVQ